VVKNTVVRDTVVKNDTVVRNTVVKDTVALGTVARAIPAFKPGRRLVLAARAGRQYSPQRRSGAR
jgi:hypothetical protein